MLDALKRKLAGVAPVDAGLTVEDGTNEPLLTHTYQAPASAATYHQVASELATAMASLADLTDKLSAAEAKAADLAAQLDEAKEFHAAKEKAALEAKLDARKQKIVAAVGTERAAALMDATASMEDAAFDAVMAAVAVSAKAEADAPLFKEVGVDADVDASKLAAAAESNPTMDYLRNKYQPK